METVRRTPADVSFIPILPKMPQKIPAAALGICRIDRKETHVRFFPCAGGSGLV